VQSQVANRFSNAALRYEQCAHIQKQAAIQFDNWLSSLGLQQPNSIAEIGCGTGFLSHLLHWRYTETMLQITDFAPGMVEYCRADFESSDLLQFQVCDGRSVRFSNDPEWIVSTMCFQWFDPLIPVLTHHFQHSRVLAFSILLDGSFSEWQAAHTKMGLSSGLQPLPDYDGLLKACGKFDAKVYAQRKTFREWHADGVSFAKSLRAIGADLPRTEHQPVNLRSVCSQLKDGLVSNYEIGFICLVKK
jgi:malonyl-CoA O-methyltransferase